MHLEQKIILLDCDGPCFNFDEKLLNQVNPDITSQDMIDLNDWDCFKLLDRHELGMAHSIMESYEFWRNLDVKKAALDGYKRFRANVGIISENIPNAGRAKI